MAVEDGRTGKKDSVVAPEDSMIRARVREGRVETQDPIPEEWEGQCVKILPMTPDDTQADLEECLAALQALGPTEFEPGERELAERLLAEQNRLSQVAMQELADLQP
jgi:hypothetical protein